MHRSIRDSGTQQVMNTSCSSLHLTIEHTHHAPDRQAELLLFFALLVLFAGFARTYGRQSEHVPELTSTSNLSLRRPDTQPLMLGGGLTSDDLLHHPALRARGAYMRIINFTVQPLNFYLTRSS